MMWHNNVNKDIIISGDNIIVTLCIIMTVQCLKKWGFGLVSETPLKGLEDIHVVI